MTHYPSTNNSFLFARFWRVSICLSLLVASTTLATTSAINMKGVRVRGVVTRRRLSSSSKSIVADSSRSAVTETSGDGSIGSRSYPPPSKFQARSGSTKSKGKSISGSRSEVSEEACIGASRSSSGSGSSSGKGGGSRSGSANSRASNTSGGKGSGDNSRRLKKGSKVKGASGSRSGAKAVKAKKCKGGSGPDREYPPPGFMEEETSGQSFSASGNKSAKGGDAKGVNAKSGASAKAAKGFSNDAAKGFVPGGEYAPEQGVSGSSSSSSGSGNSAYFGDGGGTIVSPAVEDVAVPCRDIGNLQAPTTQPMSTYTITADMQVRTSQVPLNVFYERLQIYLQKEVSLIIAGCFGIADYTEGPITNVVFATPVPVEEAVCSDNTAETDSRTGTRRTQFLSTAQEYSEPATNTDPTVAVEGEELAAVEEGITCHPTSIAVNVYHYMDLTEEQTMQVQRDLELGLTMAEQNLGNLVAVNNGDVQAPPVTEFASAQSSVQADDGSSKKVAFSMGVLGVILVSLVALKVAISRKRNNIGKRFYSEFDEDGTAIGDNLSIDYPTENELLGPTEGDLALEEANNRSAYSFRSAYLNPYGGSQNANADFILDDLNGENSSYASHDRDSRRVTYRHEPPPTPDMRRKGCC